MKPIEITGTTLCIPTKTTQLAPLKVQRVGKKTVFTILTSPTLANGQLCYAITPELQAMRSGRYDGTLQGVPCATCVPLTVSCK
jgi:hypothetical protein